MTKEEELLKREIMMRVRFVYGVRALPRVFLPKMTVLASLVAVGGFFASFPHVLHNMPSVLDAQNLFSFLVSAVLNTNLVVQGVVLGALVLSALMVRDIVRVFRVQRSALAVA